MDDSAAMFERFGFSLVRKKSPVKAKTPGPAGDVSVLVQYAGDLEVLKDAGLKLQSVSGDVITGTVNVQDVGALGDIAEVERIESARSMQPDLDLSLVECTAQQVHTGPPGRRGAGVIVGICDSGCDFTHPSFRHPDGRSRILFLWDQGLTPQPGETSPPAFGFGVEYTNAQINTALGTANPFSSVRHRDPGGHGTHVTGIAAGDGSAPGQARPGGTFIGVAPEADIIVAANRSNGAEGLGTSASTLDAVNYIFQQAATLSRPCVVNMSLGDNLGPHDGTSLLERGLDNLLGGPGRAFVKSAGNAGAAACHAEGRVTAGATENVRFNQPGGDNTANQIDLWYSGADTFRVSVIDPAGNAAGPVNVGIVSNVTLQGGNTVRIDHRNNDATNGDRRIFVTLTPGAAGTMRTGNWTIRLVSVASPSGGRFDAWIQRGAVVPTFLAPHETSARTISSPGTAREVITAANYVTRGAGVGSLATSSSRGPTRDGRPAPTVASPGMMIMSADGENSNGDPYRLDGGTSMAAPHVTGTIALMLQKSPRSTQDDVRRCLESTARSDGQTGPVPNTAWGAGKMDSNAAVRCTFRPLPPVTVSVVTNCPSIPLATCPSVTPLSCLPVSVPTQLCPVVSVVAVCPSRVACLSVVAACPSVTVGCLPLPPVPPRPPGPVEAQALAESLPKEWLGQDIPAQPEVPETGYFEYDENWFDS